MGVLGLGGGWSQWGVCSRGVCSRAVPGVPGGMPGGDPPGGTATAVDSTHPTGMHSCFQ